MEIKEISDLFQMDVGAPMPLLLSTDNNTIIAFNGVMNDAALHNAIRKETLNEDEIIVIEFIDCLHVSLGPPNDEALNGHPYYELGLESYAFFELLESDLIDKLEEINSVHPHHSSINWRKFKHYILTFHDSIFECIAENFKISTENKITDVVSDYFNLQKS